MLIGTEVQVRGEWRVPATTEGVLTDPTTIQLQIRRPDTTLDSYTYAGGTVTKEATGQFRVDYVPGTAGTYTFRWTGTGAAYAAGEGSFTIEASTL